MKKSTLALLMLAGLSMFAVGEARADADTDSLQRSMKQISEKQDRILEKLDKLASELDTVKVRISSR